VVVTFKQVLARQCFSRAEVSMAQVEEQKIR
jgi:hypothetical protein